MKKLMISFAALAIVVSCTTEKLSQDISAEESAANGTVVTLTANLPALTKATVDDKAFSWSAGDKISLPSNKGEAIFTTTNGDGIFTCTLSEGEELVSGTAKYPATTPGTSFSSIEDAKKAFMMEADYTVGNKSISFNHKSAIVKVSFTNVPSFATGLKVTEGETVVATIALSSPSENVDFFVPITPNGSKKYTFALMENDNVVKSAAKTVELIAGTYYTTPEIAVKYIQVGVRDFIYGNGQTGTWNLKDNWKVRYWKGSSTGDAPLRDLHMTETKSIPNYYTDGVFQLFYTVDVPTNSIDGFKVWCDTGGNDWFGSNADPSFTKVYVFEWDYGKEKLAYYE